MTPYSHQITTLNFIDTSEGKTFIASDPGTGKTATVLWWFEKAKQEGRARRLLVLCPKSIMKAAWFQDVKTFTPKLKAAVATGTAKQKLALLKEPRYDIVITNHDSIKLIEETPGLALLFDTCVVDESTAFKSGTAARTKSLLKLGRHWPNRIGMSGTPTPQSILDLWAQLKFVRPDKLPLFGAFRAEVCTPVTKRFANGLKVTEWQEKPGVRSALIAYFSDTIIRFAKEDCVDLPERTFRTMTVELSPSLRKIYEDFKANALLELGDTMATSVHAGALAQKLLQIASGFVYDVDHDAHCLSEERYELIAELIAERAHSLVAFAFKAQRDHLSDVLKRKGITFAVIDGDTPDQNRHKIVADFQAGEYQTVLCHPKSAGHGLTMTRADTIIWTGAVANTEWFEQFNARNHRIGQTQRTEVIMIAAENTYEQKLYQRLMQKRDQQLDLLELLKE
jgi:SNF2 family DNA or RNA helicase